MHISAKDHTIIFIHTHTQSERERRREGERVKYIRQSLDSLNEIFEC